jgi:nucleoside-diphosphate-sugar epimerase
MKVLVLGCTGFVGRNVAERFLTNSQYDVFGTTNLLSTKEFPIGIKTNQLHTVDLTEKTHVENLLQTIKPDVIIQAAAVTSGAKDIVERPYVHVTDNAIMNSRLLRTAFEHKVKHFIFMSCGVMYQPNDIPQKETDYNEHDEVLGNYFGAGWTKVYVEKMCEFYSRLGMKCTAIRHSNTYGPYDKFDVDKSHVFAATIRKVVETPTGGTITMWGDGSEERDLIYISDVVDAIETLIQKQVKPFELVNVGCGSAISIRELVQIICILAERKDIVINYDTTKPTIPFKLALDSTKMLSEYGWYPITSLWQGIQNTLYWHRKTL